MMKRMKKYLLVISVAVMCTGMCACGSSGKVSDKELEKMVENLDEQDIEDALNAMEGMQGMDSNETDNTPAAEPEVTYIVSPDPSEEIMNATLNSGLVQMDNMVFQTGCYLTADEFVSLYADEYDAIYYKGNSEKEGTYEERKDYLLEYVEDPWRDDSSVMGKQQYKYERYAITFTPKDGTNGREFNAYVVNITSPDEKITLDKGLVFTCEFTHDDVAPKYLEWVPMGFGRNGYSGEDKPEQNTINGEYTFDGVKELLNNQGFVENVSINDKTYTSWSADSLNAYVYGEPNSAGLCPVFQYTFRFNSDTNKISYVTCAITNLKASE